jgi:hypothetical protein
MALLERTIVRAGSAHDIEAAPSVALGHELAEIRSRFAVALLSQ